MKKQSTLIEKKYLIILLVCTILRSNPLCGQAFQEIQKLTALDMEENARYGSNLDISGNFAIVGAKWENKDADGNNPINNAGAVYILKRDQTGNWLEQQKLVASDRTEGFEFGYSVAISGNFAIVGAPYESFFQVKAPNRGAAYLFEFDEISETWNEVQKLTAIDWEPNANFGHAVSIHGTKAIVGAPLDDSSSGSDTGSAYVYENDGNGNWSMTKHLTASDKESNDRFGFSVDIAEEVSTVGAILKSNKAGAAYIFNRNNGSWNIEHKVVAQNSAPNHYFGYSISTSEQSFIVGAPYAGGVYGDPFYNTGAAYVFEFDGSNWVQVQELVSDVRTQGDAFGYSVAFDATQGFERNIVIGADVKAEDANELNPLYGAGLIYLYQEDIDEAWALKQKINTSDREIADFFGSSISISGNTLLSSAPLEDAEGINNAGSIYVVELNCNEHIEEEVKVVAGDRDALDFFGNSTSVYGSYAIAGAPSEDHNVDGISDELENAGAAYIYEKNLVSGTWNQVQKLVANDRQELAIFGESVAIVDNYAIVGSPRWDLEGNEDDNHGKAYIYLRDVNGTWIEDQQLISNDIDIDDNFGSSVALESNYAAIAAPGEEGLQGAVYIFERIGSTWIESQKIVAPIRSTGDAFGSSIALYGNRIVIGAEFEDHDETDIGGFVSNSGSAYVFQLNLTTNLWELEQKIVASDRGNAQDRFGSSIDMHGSNIIVGSSFQAYNVDGVSDFVLRAGAAYIYELDEFGTWNEVQKVVSSDRDFLDSFGTSVSITHRLAAIGAIYDDQDIDGVSNPLTNSGSVYAFMKDAQGLWIQTQKFVASDRSDFSGFGNAISLSQNTLFIGSSGNSTDANGANILNSAGAAYLFENICDISGSRKSVGTILGNDKLIDEVSGIRIYPNPGKEYAVIELEQSEKAHVSIIDINGKVLYMRKNIVEKRIKLDVNHLQEGIYFIRVKSGNQIKTFKFIKSL
ncbi:T9SS type A sorting domain-containing protein [Ekhidna sp.]|uniref:T9SS type A sorting domain-containing protein n=1 Tax=Ekhidna sp. TaxID=2608089 RepID=UPI0032982889